MFVSGQRDATLKLIIVAWFGAGDAWRKVIRSKLANSSLATGYGAKLVCFAGSFSVNVNNIRKTLLLKIVRGILNFDQKIIL